MIQHLEFFSLSPRRLAALSSVVLVFLLGGAGRETCLTPSDFTVTNLDDSGPGSLRWAVHCANRHSGPDFIHFDPRVRGTITLNSPLVIIDDVTIDGPGAGQITISGNSATRVFFVSGAHPKVAMTGLTISKGRAATHGGAIVNFGGSLALANMVFADNQAMGTLTTIARGGAIHNVGKLSVCRCSFRHNGVRGFDADFSGLHLGGAAGGAIANVHGGAITISDSTFEDNQALGGSFGKGTFGIYSIGLALGGAIENEGSLTVHNSQFTNNRATGGSSNISYFNVGLVGVGGGGALANAKLGTATICKCTISGNQAQGGANNKGKLGPYFVGSGIGGGIANVIGGKLHVHGCKLAGNKALGGSPGNTGTGSQAAGGGLITFAATSTVQGCLVECNQAQGGIAAGTTTSDEGGYAAGGGLTSTFAGNTTILNSTFCRNLSLGGLGGANGLGGTAGAGAINISSRGKARVQGCKIIHNRAQGGTGGANAKGGPGQGGAFEVETNGTLTLVDSLVSCNEAAAGSGGTGLGGGFYVNVTATAILQNDVITANKVGYRDGQPVGPGIGGGLNIVTGAVVIKDARTSITGNRAVTSADDVFGSVVPMQ